MPNGQKPAPPKAKRPSGNKQAGVAGKTQAVDLPASKSVSVAATVSPSDTSTSAGSPPVSPASVKVMSGSSWVSWANLNALASKSVDDLVEPFRSNVKAFIKALNDAGASTNVTETRRSDKRAYLFHWCWLIGLGKCPPTQPGSRPDIPIVWDHGDDQESRDGAREMIDGFGLAVPPVSTNAPALSSNHISGEAIDMNITWDGSITIRSKDGTPVSVPFMENVDQNTKLHSVGASYGVVKLTTDAPHWSVDGK